MPILKDTLSSTMVSCCLSNTPAWKNMVAYYTEYLLVNDETTIRKLFQVEEFSDDSDDAAIHALRTRLCSVPVHIRKELHLEDLKRFGIDENIVGMSTASLRKLDLRSIVKRNTQKYLGDYTQWSRSSTSALDYKSLLPRASVQRWLFALFFKIALPVDRLSSQSLSFRIHSPLNLTTFFRALTHLREVGYPAHWLSEVLKHLIEDRVITSA